MCGARLGFLPSPSHPNPGGKNRLMHSFRCWQVCCLGRFPRQEPAAESRLLPPSPAAAELSWVCCSVFWDNRYEDNNLRQVPRFIGHFCGATLL